MKEKGFIGILILSILGVVALSFIGLYVGSALKLIQLPWLKFDTKVNNAAKIIDKTYNADNQIYNYHWFQEMNGQIEATKVQIKTAHAAVVDFEASAGPRDKWTFEDKNEDARLKAIEFGLKSNLESNVKEYNARAGEADRGIFVDGLKTYVTLD